MSHNSMFDIEIKLQNALKSARDNLFSRVKGSIDKMKSLVEDLFKELIAETATFNERLKDECEKEKVTFLNRIENEDQEVVLADYVEEARETIVDLMISEDREVLSELLGHFKE